MSVQPITIAVAKQMLDFSDQAIGKIDKDFPSTLINANISLQLVPSNLTPKQMQTFLRKLRGALRSFKDSQTIGFSMHIGQTDDFSAQFMETVSELKQSHDDRLAEGVAPRATKVAKKAKKKSKR